MKSHDLYAAILAALFAVLVAGCSSTNTGKYFDHDGPPSAGEAGAAGASDAIPRVEKHGRATSRPYTVMGQTFYPLTGDRGLTQTGIASWYGKQFHGRKTATGERYDMYKLTAAHPTMQLPSYAKVTNLENGRSIIVRVNDRGPFIGKRIIDLSYAAAVKLGYHKKGTARVKVERITNREIASGYRPKTSSAPVAAAAPVKTVRTAAPAPAPATRITLAGSGASSAAAVRTSRAAGAADTGSAPASTTYTRIYRGGSVTVRGGAAAAPAEDRMMALAAAEPEPQQAPDSGAPAPQPVMGKVPSIAIDIEAAEADPEIRAASADLDAAERRMQQIRDREFERSARTLPPAEPAAAARGWSVQAGAFRSEANAGEAAARTEAMLSQAGINEKVRVVRDGSLFRVLVGEGRDEGAARSLSATVSEELGSRTIIVRK